MSRFFPAAKRGKYDWHLDSDSCVYVLRACASILDRVLEVFGEPKSRGPLRLRDAKPQMRPEKKRRMPFSICLFVCSYVPKRPTYGASMHCGNRRTPASCIHCIHIFIYIYMFVMTHTAPFHIHLHILIPTLILVLILVQMLILSLCIHTHNVLVHSTACRTLFMIQGFRSEREVGRLEETSFGPFPSSACRRRCEGMGQ